MPPITRGDSLGYKKGNILKDGRYHVEREVNRGGSAVVYLAFDKHHDNKKVALKVMDYTNELQVLYKSVKREVAFSAHTRHANIVQLLDVFADKERRNLVIVWEFVEGPDLLECLNRKGAALSEPEAAFYFAQLLRGLLLMHQTGFAHRDLKPENCVLEERTRTIKLIDFGLTKHIESARTMLVGTPEYMAPELVRSPTQPALLRYAGTSGDHGSLPGTGSGGSTASSSSLTGQQQQQQQQAMRRYDARKVDAWALGVLLYVLLCAQYPFSDDSAGPGSAVATQRALLSGRYRPIPAAVSAGARRIIQGLLVVDAARRMDLEDVAQDQWLLSSAMQYAAPHGLQHLVEPPLAPAPGQQQAAAAAAGASRRRGSGNDAAASAGGGGGGGLPPAGKLMLARNPTGGSVVSATTSNLSDASSVSVYTDASAGQAAATSGEAGAVRVAAGPGNGIRMDRDQQQLDPAGKHYAAHHEYQHRQQSQQKTAGPGTSADPFMAAAIAAAARGGSNTPADDAAGGIKHDTLADLDDSGDSAKPRLFGQQALPAVKEESSLQASLKSSFEKASPAAGVSGGRQQQQQQQRQRGDEEGGGGCACGGCVVS